MSTLLLSPDETSARVSLNFSMSTVASSFQFNSATLLVTEGGGDAVVRVTRLGNTSTPATVNYATSDTAAANCNTANTGSASSRCDYETAQGTLQFTAGETSKTIAVPIVNDAYAEGNESFNINLANPGGSGSRLGSPSRITVIITDNDAINGPTRSTIMDSSY